MLHHEKIRLLIDYDTMQGSRVPTKIKTTGSVKFVPQVIE